MEALGTAHRIGIDHAGERVEEQIVAHPRNHPRVARAEELLGAVRLGQEAPHARGGGEDRDDAGLRLLQPA